MRPTSLFEAGVVKVIGADDVSKVGRWVPMGVRIINWVVIKDDYRVAMSLLQNCIRVLIDFVAGIIRVEGSSRSSNLENIVPCRIIAKDD